MAGNPPDSPWRGGGPRAARKRPKVEISLSPDAHEALELLAEREQTSRSAVIERLVLAAAKRAK